MGPKGTLVNTTSLAGGIVWETAQTLLAVLTTDHLPEKTQHDLVPGKTKA